MRCKGVAPTRADSGQASLAHPPSMPGLSRCFRCLHSEIAFPQLPLKELQRDLHALPRQYWVIPRPFIAQEGMRAVEFQPLVICPRALQRLADLVPSREWHMRVFATVDHQQLALDLTPPGALQ